MELYNDTNVPLEFEIDGKSMTLLPGATAILSNVLNIHIVEAAKPKPKETPVKKPLTGPSVDERIKALVLQVFDIPEEDIVPSTDILNDLNADTVDLLKFFMGLEETFQTTIHGDDAERMMTLREVEEFLHSKGKL